MITVRKFDYEPGEHEAEKASNSYLMSLIAIIAGLPFPIINLIATFGFYLGNRKASYFVRWHCTQALLSQFSLLMMNSVAFWWTMSILFGSEVFSNEYFAYAFIIIVFNLFEFIATIYTAVNTGKGIHVEWFLYGTITDALVKPNKVDESRIF